MGLVDSYSESNQDAGVVIEEVHPSSVSPVSGLGQSFTGDGSDIASCKFYAKKTGSPGNIIARLYAHTGTFGVNGKPTGGALDSSDSQAAGGWTTSYELREFTGFSGYTLVNGTKYCIVLEALNGTWNGSNLVTLGNDTSSPTHAGNYVYYNISRWAAWGGSDFCFYVYSVTPGWAGGDVLGVDIATIAKINGVALADITKVNGIA